MTSAASTASPILTGQAGTRVDQVPPPPMPQAAPQALRALTEQQAAFYHEHGYLRLPGVFSEMEMAALERDLTFLMGSWASESVGWTGPWRKVYMDEATESRSRLVTVPDHQL